MTDKRELSEKFADRLQFLLDRRSENISRFATRCGIDRTALSQFLDPAKPRLPRAETLVAISIAEGVSIDWLVGLSAHDQSLGEMTSLVDVELGTDGIHDSRLAEWHKQAYGYKIRYIPSSLPDLLRTDAVLNYEFSREQEPILTAKSDQLQAQLDYTRRPETDMEVIMPYQRLEIFAKGHGIWSQLNNDIRLEQLAYMGHLLAELYPTFRLYLYDERTSYSSPFTVFGVNKAVLYLGDMYLVINGSDLIRKLTRRFDNLIRKAVVTPDQSATYISDLIKQVKSTRI